MADIHKILSNSGPYVAKDGSLGIGVAEPSKKLEVVSNTTYDGVQILGSSIPTLGIIDTTNNAKFVAYVRDSDATIGMETNHPLTINTNNTERMRITSDGLVGIGTTSPTSVFEVYGGSTGTNDIDRYVRFKASNGEKRFDFHIGGTGNASVLDMYSNDGTTQGVQIASAGTTYFNGGSVGIGTTSPSNKLHVYGGSSQDVIARFEATGTGTSDYSEIHIANNNNDRLILGSIGSNYTNSSWAGMRYVYSTVGDLGLKAIASNGNVRIYAGGSAAEKMRITSSGNIGIGNTSPSSKLHVTGDTYISGQFGQGVATANKLVNYGAEFRTSGASAQIFFGRDGNDIGTGGIGADSTYVLSVWKSDFSRPFIVKQTGEVGIGTTSPSQMLHLEKADNPMILISRGNSNRVLLGDTGSNNGGDLLLYDSSGSNTARIRAGSVSYLNGGNVGIGTTSPSTKFHVHNGEATIASSTDGLKLSYSNGNSSGVIDTAFSDNALEFRTNGTSKMFITNAGNVGIGTNSPNINAKLHLYSALSATDVALRITSNADSKTLIGFGDTVDQTAGAIKYDNSNSSMAFEVLNNTEAMRINSSGNVGIGTTSPEEKLTIATGNVQFRKSASAANNSLGFLGWKNTYATGTHVAAKIDVLTRNESSSAHDYTNLVFYTWNGYNSLSEKMRIADDGNVGIGYDNPYKKLHLHNPTDSGTPDCQMNFTTGVTEAGDGNGFRVGWNGTVGQLWLFENSGIRFGTNNGEKMRITSGGEVGIGTTSPAEKLEVNGSIKLGSMKLENISAGGRIGFNRNTSNGAIYNSSYEAYQIQANGDGYLETQVYNSSGTYISSMVLTDDVKLGIGTTSPSNTLDVNGGAEFNAETYIRSQSNVGLRVQTIDQGTTGTDGLRVGLNGTHAFVWNYENTPLSFGTNGSQKATILANGNVGIGTTSPTFKLDVFDSAINVVRVGSNDNARIIINSNANASATKEASQLSFADGGSTKWTLYKETNNDLYLYNAAANKYPIHAKAGGDIVIMEDGNNLGVGASSPTEKLHVEGRIRIGTTPVICSHGNITMDIDQDNNSGSNYFRVTRDGEVTELFKVQEDGNSTFAGTVKAATTFIADAVDPGNPTPSENNLRVSGYGIIGKRGAVYVTNAGESATDSVQIGVGGVHASNTKIHVNPTNSIFYTNIKAGADSTYDIGTSATRFSNIYADTLHGDGSNLTGITATDNTKLPLAGGTMGSDATITGTDALIIKADSQILFRGDAGSNIASIKTVNTDYDIIELLDNNRMRWRDGMEIYLDDSGATDYMMFTTETIGAGNHALHRFAGYEFQGTGLGNNTIMKLVGTVNAGYVELYHSNVKKFETTSNGIAISDYLVHSGDTNTFFKFNSGGWEIQSSGGPTTDISATNGVTSIYGKGAVAISCGSSQVSTFSGDISPGTNKVLDRDIPCLFNSNFEDAYGTTIIVVPFNNNTENNVSTRTYNHNLTMPYAGKLTKIVMKHVSGTLSSGFTTQLFLYVNGSQQASSSEISLSNDSVTWTPTTNNTFSAGDVLSFGYQKSALKTFGGVSFGVAIELTDYDI